MPSIKLTKSVVDIARATARDYEIRDTIAPGFLCKVTPAGRKTFMLSYRTPIGDRRKPALGAYGQITVDQVRKLAQDFLASVRGGADPSQERQVGRLHAFDVAEAQAAHLLCPDQRPDVRFDAAAVHREGRGFDRPVAAAEDAAFAGLGGRHPGGVDRRRVDPARGRPGAGHGPENRYWVR